MNNNEPKKIRVLIADDEIRISKLIEKLIQWEALGLTCIGMADSGQKALTMIKKEKPDILITDIRMPQINGIELIRLTKELDPSIKIIVISGFKEFEYAHKALQYGVNDYLLKPLKAKELHSVLSKIVQAITNEAHEKNQLEQKELLIDKSEQIIKSNFLNNLIEHPGKQESLADTFPASLNAPYYLAFIVKLDYLKSDCYSKNLEKIVAEKITAIIQDSLDSVVKDNIICPKPYSFIYCITNYTMESKSLLQGSLKLLLSELVEYLQVYDCFFVTIGVSDEKNNFEDIRFCLSEAYRAVQNRIIHGTNGIIPFSLIAGQIIDTTEGYLSAHLKNLQKSIDNFSLPNFEITINDIYRSLLDSKELDATTFFDTAFAIIDVFFEHLIGSTTDFHEEKAKIIERLMHAFSVSSLKKLLKVQLTMLLGEAHRNAQSKNTRPIRDAQSYIEKNYNKKISLEDLAEIVNLNPVYFSTLFKKEVGFNISTYILNLRIENAKLLLKEGNDTIAAIAEKVGYKDSRFFSQTFAKEVGIKPAVYRKLHS